MTPQNQLDALDIVSILSLALGYKNLLENREQSAHNDVSAANDKQANFLLEELTKKFEEQNILLNKILKAVNTK